VGTGTGAGKGRRVPGGREETCLSGSGKVRIKVEQYLDQTSSSDLQCPWGTGCRIPQVYQNPPIAFLFFTSNAFLYVVFA
jgi:hypothetical protein